MAIVILSLGLLVFFGHFLAGFFQRTKIPDVLVLMLAGIGLGQVTHIVEPDDFGLVGPVFTTLALIVILFEGGIHLNIRHVRQAARDTLAITLTTFALTALLVAYLAELLLPIDFQTAVLLGTILGGTSSAIVLPMIRVLKLGTVQSNVLFLESAITDVLVIVLTLGILEGITAGDGTAVAGSSLAISIAGDFLLAGLVGTVGAFGWSAILDRVRRVPNTVFTTVAYVFILYGVSELLGYSGAIAALTFGIAVANFPNLPERWLGRVFAFQLNPLTDHEKAFFAEAVFLVKTFFFVYLGASMRFVRWYDVLASAGLVGAILLARLMVIRFLAPHDTTRRDGALMTALVPKGLASAVVASIPVQTGLAAGSTILSVVYPTIFFSIVSCAVLVFMIEQGMADRWIAMWFSKLPVEAQPEDEEHVLISAIDAMAITPEEEAITVYQDPNVVDFDRPASTDPEEPDAPEDQEGANLAQ